MRNTKFTLLTLSIALAAANLSGCSKELTYDEYLLEAQTQIEQGDASSAIVSLKNAVRLQPKDANSRYELGSLYLNEGDLWSAEKELEKALELGSESLMLLPKIAKVKMLLSKYDETYEIADNSGAYNNEQYVMILTYAGLAAISDNKKDMAEDYISQASILSADSLYSQVGNAWLSFSKEKYTDVSETLGAILSQSETFSEALLLSGHLHQAQFNYEKAVEMYTAYLEQHPRQFQTRLYLINSLLSAKDYDTAEKNLVLLNKIYKEHPLVNLYNAQLQYVKEDYSSAKLFAEKTISANGNLYLAQLIAGVSAYKLQEYELAYSYLQKVVPLLPVNHELKKLFAVLQMQLGFTDDAQLSFDEMDAVSVNDINILNSASRAFAKSGDNDVAESLLGKVVKASPDNNELALQYSALKLANGDESQLGVLEQLAKNAETSSDAPMILATYYINEKDYENAFRVAKEWQSTQSGKIKGQLLEGFIFVNKNEIDSAKNVFSGVLEQENNNIPALYYLGEFAFNNKNWEKAKTFYIDILKFEPTHKASVARLSYINAQLGKADETIEILNSLLEKYPNNQDIITDLSINLSASGKTKEAINLIEKSDVANKSTRFNRNLAQLYVKDFRFNDAKDIYKSLTKAEPSNEDLWLEYAEADEKLGNIESALTTVNTALNITTSKKRLKLLKASLLLTLERYESASTLVNDLLVQYPNNIGVTYLKGQLDLKQNDAASASERFSLLYQESPNNEFALRWAQASVKNGDSLKAIAIIEKHEELHSLNSMTKAFLAELLLEENAEKSKELYLDLNNAHPGNVTVLNNLSWAYNSLGGYKESEAYAEEAYTVSKSSITMDTYSRALISNGNADKAITLINEKSNKPYMNESVKLTLIEAYIAAEKLDDARSVLSSFNNIPDNLKGRYNTLSNQLN